MKVSSEFPSLLLVDPLRKPVWFKLKPSEGKHHASLTVSISLAGSQKDTLMPNFKLGGFPQTHIGDPPGVEGVSILDLKIVIPPILMGNIPHQSMSVMGSKNFPLHTAEELFGLTISSVIAAAAANRNFFHIELIPLLVGYGRNGLNVEFPDNPLICIEDGHLYFLFEC